jgi:hypothetical protein
VKTLLTISVVSNVALGVCLVCALAAEKRQPAAATITVASSTRSEQNPNPGPTPLPVAERPVSPPFRWSQLESPDYRAYVKNLRSIGCPEPTVRAIVGADVHAVFHKFGSELDEQLSEINNASWSVRLKDFNREQALRAQAQELPGMEADEIAELLGLKRATDSIVTASQSVPPPPVADQPVSLPLVFQSTDLTVLNATPDQIQTINDVRQSFLKEIGGANQDPTDPAYLRRWQQALPAADDLIRGMLGMTFFENYQLAVVKN